MIGRRGLSSIAGAFAVLAVLTACSNGGPPTTPAGNAVGNNTIATQNYGGNGNSAAASQGSSNNQGSTNNGGGSNSGGSGSSGGSDGTIDIPSTAANSSYSVQCTNNDTVVLANAGQVKLTITGHCSELEVDSGQNDVTVDSVDRVAFNGANNNVIYHCGSPQVSGGGVHDNISQQTGSCGSSGGSTGGSSNSGSGGNSGGGAAGGTINIAQTGSTETDVCNNSNVNILADGATVTLTGTCASIAIAGDNNTVVVDSAAAIAITGNSDNVTYHSGSPTVSKLGTGDNVHQG